MRLPVLLLAAGLVAGCAALPSPGAGGATALAQGLPVPDGAQQARVVRHVDGDTVHLRGRGAGPLPAAPTRVRVLLIDAPEVHQLQECLGEQASRRLGELLPHGSTVHVETDRDTEDRYQRTLLHVWNEAGHNVGEVLVREGLAEVLFVPPNDRYLEHFEQAEREARQAGRGLWSACR